MKKTFGMILSIILFHWIIPFLVLIAVVWAFLAYLCANIPPSNASSHE
jgi:uncharacterized membrane protein (DUF485 family)